MTQTDIRTFDLTEGQAAELQQINKTIDLYKSRIKETPRPDRLLSIIEGLENDKKRLLRIDKND